MIYGRVEKDFPRPEIIKAAEALKVDYKDKDAAERVVKQYICFLVAQHNYEEYLNKKAGLQRGDHLRDMTSGSSASGISQGSSLKSDITILSDPKSLTELLGAKSSLPVDDQISQDGTKSKQVKRKQ